ncbi:MscL family protein [Candidatus Dojkabacteria bacterium]|uniref:MscL family protein n=1 Tax=Candidatus Dojkabacteria bacterium TaxID=2099670 RepID=A0A955HXE5_9BACT|nr:MscL family protein [Candidatus Dojkabacteria bacterium]MCB9790470.1 MscL family protein [Candidatus Nomurabacteria bacterium]
MNITNHKNSKRESLISRELSEFSTFLGKYSVIALAIGTIVGQSSKEVVDVLVNGIIQPFINLLLPNEHIFQTTLKLSGETFLIGDLLNVTVQLMITMIVTFIAAKYLFRDLQKIGISKETSKDSAKKKK